MIQRIVVTAALATCAIVAGASNHAQAQLPVIDSGNILQNAVTAAESVNQSAQLILSYKNQLAQYERMLTDGVVPFIYLWDQISETVDKLRRAEETLKQGRAELTQFLDPNYYRGSSCYNSAGAKGGCFANYQKLVQTLQKRETDAQNQRDEQIDAQLKSLRERADKEKRLQQNAATTKGQLEAIQSTNQLLDAQYAELRDLRALLVTQQQVAAEEQRKRLAAEAAAQALSEKWHSGDNTKPGRPGKW